LVAAESAPIKSEGDRGRAGDSQQPENLPTLCEAAALGCFAHVAGGIGRSLTVARAGILAARSVGAKVPADARVEHARTGWGGRATAAGIGAPADSAGTSTRATSSGRVQGSGRVDYRGVAPGFVAGSGGLLSV